MATAAPNPRVQNQLTELAGAFRGALIGVGLVSAIINILYLAGSFFMLEVYDRVLPSQSIPTLIGLAILVTVLYAFQGVFDLLRGRLLIRIASAIDERLSRAVFEATVRLPLIVGTNAELMQPVRNLDQVRSFLSSMGPPAFFDLPWMPFYLFICFAFHPLLGITAGVGAILLVVVAALAEILARDPSKVAKRLGEQRQLLTEASRRNAEVLGAMGMALRVEAVWSAKNAAYLQHSQRVSDVVGALGALSKVLRMLIQSAVLAVGAYLVIKQEATGGVIIAGSILASRALAPVEMTVGSWKVFLSAREAWGRLKEAFKLLPVVPAQPLQLPPPERSLVVESVSAAPPGSTKAIIQDVSFTLDAGEGLGIVGASASGKSSLARVIVGIWKPLRGKVRLDGAALEQWTQEALGLHVGYLPQSVELLAGTVAQNISRFADHAESTGIVAAATAASVHEMILKLPAGYETSIGEDGNALSAGQRQRIALARALYGNPFLVVLDEPNSNLDQPGEEALTQAILGVRKRGGIVIVVAHRPSALAAVDRVLVMNEGRVQLQGPTDEILRRVTRVPPHAPSPPGLKIVADGQGAV